MDPGGESTGCSASSSGCSEDRDGEDAGTRGGQTLEEQARSQEQLLDVPFEQLESLKADGSLHLQGRRLAAAQARKIKRENKNRPVERTSKKPVPRLREVIQVAHSEARDPRFSSLSGALQTDRFRKQYAFLYDEQLPAERQELKDNIKKVKRQETRKELQAQLVRVEQQIRLEQARRRKAEREAAAKAEERAAVRTGKRAFFPKRSEKRRRELVERFHELEATGRLEKAMAKRAKRNAAKDHRYVPASRR